MRAMADGPAPGMSSRSPAPRQLPCSGQGPTAWGANPREHAAYGGCVVFHTAMAEGDLGSRSRSFVRVRAGRIVEVHVRRLADVGDVAALHAQVREAIRHVGPEPIVCADHRLASPLASDVADACSRAMRQLGRAVVRGALLLDPGNTMYNLQIDRVVRCSGSARRLLTDIDDLRAWVGAALAGSERDACGDLFAVPRCSSEGSLGVAGRG